MSKINILIFLLLLSLYKSAFSSPPTLPVSPDDIPLPSDVPGVPGVPSNPTMPTGGNTNGTVDWGQVLPGGDNGGGGSIGLGGFSIGGDYLDELDQLNGQLDDSNQAINRVADSLDGLTGPLGDMNQSVDGMSSSIDGLNGTIDRRGGELTTILGQVTDPAHLFIMGASAASGAFIAMGVAKVAFRLLQYIGSVVKEGITHQKENQAALEKFFLSSKEYENSKKGAQKIGQSLTTLTKILERRKQSQDMMGAIEPTFSRAKLIDFVEKKITESIIVMKEYQREMDLNEGGIDVHQCRMQIKTQTLLYNDLQKILAAIEGSQKVELCDITWDMHDKLESILEILSQHRGNLIRGKGPYFKQRAKLLAESDLAWRRDFDWAERTRDEDIKRAQEKAKREKRDLETRVQNALRVCVEDKYQNVPYSHLIETFEKLEVDLEDPEKNKGRVWKISRSQRFFHSWVFRKIRKKSILKKEICQLEFLLDTENFAGRQDVVNQQYVEEETERIEQRLNEEISFHRNYCSEIRSQALTLCDDRSLDICRFEEVIRDQKCHKGLIPPEDCQNTISYASIEKWKNSIMELCGTKKILN